MLPDSLTQKYTRTDTPYRKIFLEENATIAADFSDMIPYWYLEYFDYSKTLLEKVCGWAESRNYFGFYTIIDSRDIETHISFIKSSSPKYESVIEEIIPSNQKSKNVMYWDWICDSVSTDFERTIVLSILLQQHR
jgi:hypothetical protein